MHGFGCSARLNVTIDYTRRKYKTRTQSPQRPPKIWCLPPLAGEVPASAEAPWRRQAAGDGGLSTARQCKRGLTRSREGAKRKPVLLSFRAFAPSRLRVKLSLPRRRVPPSSAARLRKSFGARSHFPRKRRKTENLAVRLSGSHHNSPAVAQNAMLR